MGALKAYSIQSGTRFPPGASATPEGVNFSIFSRNAKRVELLLYNHKHNESNGEENRDGANDNLSWNCGFEGETADPTVVAIRRRQAKNFIAILMISRGVPMLLAGDEILRTQCGNNNAWCRDNEISWFDWSGFPPRESTSGFYHDVARATAYHGNF
jgi:glycogen operon protein